MNRIGIIVGLLVLLVACGMHAHADVRSSSAQDAPPDAYLELKRTAEAQYQDGAYRRALELYQQAATMQLPAEESRWVQFRIGDTMWRNEAVTSTRDDSTFEKARETLNNLLGQYTQTENRDDLWAMVHRSLGDFWWARQNSRNWNQGWQHYAQALDYWAGHRDLDLARARYLEIVFDASSPEWYSRYTYYQNNVYVPAPVLENAVKIAESTRDVTHAKYLLAMRLRGEGGWTTQNRVAPLFEDVIDAGDRADWYDDALYRYAEWLAYTGRPIRQENGQWGRRPDYERAIELYRTIVREYRPGTSRYIDDARRRIDDLTSPALSVNVSNVFLPGSIIQFNLHWRNLDKATFTLHEIDLTTELQANASDLGPNEWLKRIATGPAQPMRRFDATLEVAQQHAPGQKEIRLEQSLAPGAYLLEAKSGAMTAHELLLVTDATIVTKTIANEVIIYYCDAVTGTPIANANVALYQFDRTDGRQWRVERHSGSTGEDGLARIELSSPVDGRSLLVTARREDRQAFDTNYVNAPPSSTKFKVYAYTDRTAYRPGDTVNWKATIRGMQNGSYVIPETATVNYSITDPRGTVVERGPATMNAYGSVWGSLNLDENDPLGAYTINFTIKHGTESDWRGGSQLFRLEEYKLPEYEVTITTGKNEQGQPKTYQLGERVSVDIHAKYYFGAPVANADVQVVVYQRPFWRWWQPPRPYDWLYEDSASNARQRYYGRGNQILREEIKTDPSGTATFSFDTLLTSNQDYEYVVEARVVDSSRREITGQTSIRVTRQAYFAHLSTEHNIRRPGDDIDVDVKTIDANEHPVETSGTLRIYRQVWREVWISPTGREVTGDELHKAQRETALFPPPPSPGTIGWRVKHRGYQSTLVDEATIRTDASGAAQYTFRPEKIGYYRIEWLSESGDLYPVTDQTYVWVTTKETTRLGYHQDGVDIIVDKDSFKVGQTAPVMISTRASGRHVLMTISSDVMHDVRVLHLDGKVKLVEVDVTESFIPNVMLEATMVDRAELHVDREELVVPPVSKFLNIDVTMDQSTYQPGMTGSMTVRATDADGNPVRAELGLTMMDASIYSIQQDLAGDPRQAFYGERRPLLLRSSSSVENMRYVRLVKQEEVDANGVAGERQDELLRVVDSMRLKREVDGRSAGDREAGQMGGQLVSGQRGFDGGGFGGRGEAQMMENRAAQRDMAVPSAPPASEMKASGGLEARDADAGNDAPLDGIEVRTDFRVTAVWEPSVVTNEDGVATIDVPFPDSTTRWVAIARAATRDHQFGIGETSVETRKPLVARLQAPRFFTVGDEVTITAILNNNSDTPFDARAVLEMEGLELLDTPDSNQARISADDASSLGWRVRATGAGMATITLKARAGDHTDGMQKSYPVVDHGIQKLVYRGGRVRGDEIAFAINLPQARREGSTDLTVQVTPSMATTMLDALPYLIGYPYGCTEQTMSRFLPTSIVARTLDDLGVDPALAMNRVFGGITDASADDRAKPNSLEKLDAMANAGLKRLYDFQNSDGSWGWWKNSPADRYMTAYVLWGLAIAMEADIDVDEQVVTRAAGYLRTQLVEAETRPDMQAWMLHALASYQHALTDNAQSSFEKRAFENLWEQRGSLNAYTTALLALAAHYYDRDEQASVLLRNLENGVKVDRTPDTSVVKRGNQQSRPDVIATAHWGAAGRWYRWSEGPVETTSFVLRAMLAIDPLHELVEPATNWLLKNRRGAQWSNTRDTAIAVLTLTDYLKSSGELSGTLGYELFVNGKSIANRTIEPDALLTSASTFTIDRSLVRSGANDIRIVRSKGDGPIYFAAAARFFSEEEPITPAGNELFVRRNYYKLVPYETLLKGYSFDRVLMEDGASVRSGERIEVVLTVESKNNYEYLVFEDHKPAGVEAVQVQSGQRLMASELSKTGVDRRFGNDQDVQDDFATDANDYTGATVSAYQELRDTHVAMFFSDLPQGVWEIRYELRAETPGAFHTLPLVAHAMYVPEIRANSRELRMSVYERE